MFHPLYIFFKVFLCLFQVVRPFITEQDAKGRIRTYCASFLMAIEKVMCSSGIISGFRTSTWLFDLEMSTKIRNSYHAKPQQNLGLVPRI